MGLASAPDTEAATAAPPDPAPSPISWQHRVLEILPGLVTWAAVLAPVVLVLYYPEPVVIAIVCLDVYWFVRSLIVVFGIKQTFDRLQHEKAVDWWQQCLDLTAE